MTPVEARTIDMDGEYPSEEGLEAIRSWPFGEAIGLFHEMRRVWRWPSYLRITARRAYVSTGGWSGHEDMMGALHDNHMVWAFAFLSERRGGHYVFDLTALRKAGARAALAAPAASPEASASGSEGGARCEVRYPVGGGGHRHACYRFASTGALVLLWI